MVFGACICICSDSFPVHLLLKKSSNSTICKEFSNSLHETGQLDAFNLIYSMMEFFFVGFACVCVCKLSDDFKEQAEVKL